MKALTHWGKGVFDFKQLSNYAQLTGNEGGGCKDDTHIKSILFSVKLLPLEYLLSLFLPGLLGYYFTANLNLFYI